MTHVLNNKLGLDIPKIDQSVPAKLETATFALG